MDSMHLDSACRSWQSAMKSLGRKKKNWAALCHGWHAFRFHMLFIAECHEEFGKEKEKLGSTLHGWHAFRLRMPFMAEYHEEFGKEKEKLGSTLPWMAHI